MDKFEKLAYGFQTLDCSKNYTFGRPSYPVESVELLKELGIEKDSLILDLAAGTGKFTQVLARNGFNNIIAVEPSSGFRQECSSVLNDIKEKENKLLNFKVLDGLSTSIPLPDSSADCITVAHAFHWTSNIESMKEISRVLKPNGLLVILWIKSDPNKNSPELLKEIVQLYKNSKYNGNNDGRKSPTAHLLENWRDVFDEIKSNKELHYLINPDLIDHPTISYTESTCQERVIANSLSQSYISLLPDEKKQIFIDQLKSNMQNFQETKDNKQFNIVYKVDIHYTRKP
ncbi:hypothetical protein DICPUDRAFT_29130 [Dictyostelium purpureum]|uniref:Methyltransferase type 11 domain-containing protein n=1 Tax=Dictyostelium purpureum TaxID=5786 RepID=F0ZD14_DICPU|nr:uncharacterized protein DICPUDRAFT_29130 [Dictyostelium purpureum]EGC38187.1 hypothetical protein DICPUDRAFT_29130 [Dictyostelium purpureum]|eukprot:XP_003285314.1 hypothetical protein DICPUDRAFT_29130 [Dictyostelium purpureum]